MSIANLHLQITYNFKEPMHIHKESKIYLFKDRTDYVKELSSDDIVNIIGTKGSGKTTSSLKYINDDNYIVINCDRFIRITRK